MTWTQRLISGAAIALIFAAGFLTGSRWGGTSAPEAEEADESSGRRTHEERLAFMDERLGLDDSQKEAVMASFLEWEKNLRKLEIDDDEARLGLLMDCFQEMRTVLKPEQEDDFEAMFREIRRRKTNEIRRMQRLFDKTYGP
ncbi:hypothetical protein HAHE_32690 [Haloferula helveola]|uniref:Periplasmic heavy metal sensor n=1 Tax=Haloferula helveola TaxID=490095 RepID=A0ABN6H6T7_9BACT|nr:hypothetical protein HAHE_32690 [Haloferula helveola]